MKSPEEIMDINESAPVVVITAITRSFGGMGGPCLWACVPYGIDTKVGNVVMNATRLSRSERTFWSSRLSI